MFYKYHSEGGDINIVEFNSLAPGRCGINLRIVIFKFITQNSSLGIHCEIAVMWMPQDHPNEMTVNLTGEKSKLDQVMAYTW